MDAIISRAEEIFTLERCKCLFYVIFTMSGISKFGTSHDSSHLTGLILFLHSRSKPHEQGLAKAAAVVLAHCWMLGIRDKPYVVVCSMCCWHFFLLFSQAT